MAEFNPELCDYSAHCKCMQIRPCGNHHYSDCQPNWGKKEEVINEALKSCGVCGAGMVYIRGRHPGYDKRLVCPTCLAEKMDSIREISDKDYGRAYNSTPSSLKD